MNELHTDTEVLRVWSLRPNKSKPMHTDDMGPFVERAANTILWKNCCPGDK